MIVRRRIGSPPRDADQHEPATVPPGVVPIVAIPVVEHGVFRIEDGTDGLAVGICGTGLSPPTPSSVEPMGMPRRPTLEDEVAVVGDEADAAGWPDVVPVMLAHVPEAVPTLPPPSNVVDDADVPAVDIPLPTELPVIAPPDRLPANELMLVQVVVLSAAEPSGETPEVIGLTPGELNSVAPRGIPVPGTAGAGPMPSGEVMPSGAGVLPDTCARTEPELKKTKAVAIASERVMLLSSPACLRPRRMAAPRAHSTHAPTPADNPALEQGLATVATSCPILRRLRTTH
jgi:hypothetical protein